MSCIGTLLSVVTLHSLLSYSNAYFRYDRDLHDENILVTLREFPDDPTYPFEYCYMLSDIGEGKMLHTSSTNPEEAEDHYASYGNPLYRAQEVTGPSGWTKAADVWAFGIISLKLLEMRRLDDRDCMKTPTRVIDAAQEQHPGKNFSCSPGDVGFIVPLSLKRVLEPCFRHDPNERPDVHTVAVGMDNVTLEFFSEDKAQLENNTSVRWTYWNWNETKAAGFKGKGLATSGWNGDLDSTLDDMGQLTLDDVPCLD
jgi:serine/threonine protein kinase